jgi:hypothetical protein
MSTKQSVLNVGWRVEREEYTGEIVRTLVMGSEEEARALFANWKDNAERYGDTMVRLIQVDSHESITAGRKEDSSQAVIVADAVAENDPLLKAFQLGEQLIRFDRSEWDLAIQKYQEELKRLADSSSAVTMRPQGMPVPHHGFRLSAIDCSYWTGGYHIIASDGSCRCGKKFVLLEVVQ